MIIQVATINPVKIILWETREQVHPAYTTLSEFFDVEFIAYGGASVSITHLYNFGEKKRITWVTE